MNGRMHIELDKWKARLEREGYWIEHAKYPLADWRHEIANDDTRQSYRHWVNSQIEMAHDEAPS